MWLKGRPLAPSDAGRQITLIAIARR